MTVTLGERRRFPMSFSFIPPGSFLMGSPAGEAGRQDVEVRPRVTLTRGFWLGRHPVTQAQWQAVTGRSPRGFRRMALPVQRASWDECDDFCRQLGDETRRRFRLPTEAEWEFACRCGTTTAFYNGEALSVDDANYNGEETFGPGRRGVSRGMPTPVGNFPPNAFGLYDMAGNIWEWCFDLFGPYRVGESVDPLGADSGSERVLRGGSWYGGRVQCRSAYRSSGFPGSSGACLGCRVVLCPEDQGP
jgi:formylglycine-generating enzyme required for sulfatase activity